ncbi:Pkinase-domain-containing protein [Sodiomyces alkalinus F11]|uniref:Pkinase-domain-containing protein n=1 Tax=Sodiomyces alkalinus (strain CBS 110278 / VKM F-3762 / F11) TaxID=1314773 RepID=A0A3N2PQQ6_SODAK|nr:Pkinase-domain-containing protein [Sodiomyces alkalinus F11]ROT36841.1 Pkinase-domain-containing protein [Sodiomyces alkalinus F11]
MAPPRAEKSQLKRPRVSPALFSPALWRSLIDRGLCFKGSLPEDDLDSKKPRRSERLSVNANSAAAPDNNKARTKAKGAANKTPVTHEQHLPSPLTHLGTTESESEEALRKEPTATPPQGRPSQVNPREDTVSQTNVLSSPPQDTQAFSQYPPETRDTFPGEVEDEAREGVWGYLLPLNAKYGPSIAMRKRTSCPLPKASGGGGTADRKGKSPLRTGDANGNVAGGYLIGRHPECDIVVDDASVSNRHCLIFTENKGGDTVAIVEDLSSNGTFVNEALLGRNQRRELQQSDEIAVLDKERFIFRYPKTRQTSAFLQSYTLLEKLGKGHFAEVFLCVEKSTGQRYAVKVFTKTPGMEERTKQDGLQQEIAVLMGVSHPNVLCLKDTFNERNAVYLVLELASEGELFNFIVQKQKLTENETRKLFIQLFQGVKYLHERNIVHRDIKPENILMVDKDLRVKLADFGLAKIIGEESFTTTLCGTPSYVAPEILADSKHRKYTKAVDVWSLGVVLYICLCGFPPFSDELFSKDFPYTLSQQIRSGRFDYPSPYWDSVGDPALDLIDSMLVVDPERRYTIDQCLAHPWVTQGPPNVYDSTDGLVGGIRGLEVQRRGMTRERTLLASLNTVDVATRPVGDSQTPVKIFSKNPDVPEAGKAGASAIKEPGPAHNRAVGEFVAMGGKGDEQLFSNDDKSVYSTADVTDVKKKSKDRR